MSRAFTPVSLIAGLAAGQLAKKLFTKVWGELRGEEPPSPEHREISMATLVVALIAEGAIARLVRGLTDHQLRLAWSRSTGVWPGEERPEPE